eukprot:70798_1
MSSLKTAEKTNTAEVHVHQSNQKMKLCTLPHHHRNRWSKITKLLANCTINTIDELRTVYARLPIQQTVVNQLSCLEALLHSGDAKKHKIKSNVFFRQILTKIINLVLICPKIFTKPLVILSAQIHQSMMLNALQCAAIISCSFFGLHDRENPVHSMDLNGIVEATFSDVNFTQNNGFAALLNINNQTCRAKLYMILHYFMLFNEDEECSHLRTITFHRCVLNKNEMLCSNTLQNCDIPLKSNTFNVNHIGKIQNIDTKNDRALLIDFANKFISGGTLSGGNCQEEILFCIYPECIVSALFCEQMSDNESIVIENCRQWNNDNDYSGYGDSLDIPCHDAEQKQMPIIPHRCDTIVAMDALVCFSDNFETINQYKEPLMLREINKCYVAFRFGYDRNDKYIISTGNFGCGAFGGDLQLKSMLQWIASIMASKRDVEYYSFNHPQAKLLQNVVDVCSLQKHFTVKDLWTILTQHARMRMDSNLCLYEYILVTDKNKTTDTSTSSQLE